MTRKELAERVNELLIERATSETKTALHEKAMSLIDFYVESREIPPPPLKWVEMTDGVLSATIFGYRFAIFEHTTWSAGQGHDHYFSCHLNGDIISMRESCLQEVCQKCADKWAEIWEKEMGQAI